MKKIVLLEFYEEFSEFQEYIGKNGRDISEFTLVVLQLKLQAQLKAENIAFSTTLPYLNNGAFERILLKFEDIRKYVDDNFAFEDDKQVKNAYKAELLHYVELLVNYIGGILELLQSIYNADKNIELYACLKYHISRSVFIFEDRMLGLLVKKFAIKNNLGFHLYGQRKKHDAKPEPFSAPPTKGSLTYLICLALIRLYVKLFYTAQIIIPTTTYGFKQLINELKRKNRGLLFIIPYDNEEIKWYKRYGGLLSGIFTGKVHLDMNALPIDAYINEQNRLKEKVDLLLKTLPGNLYEICGIDYRDIINSKMRIAFTEHLCLMVQRAHQMFQLVNMFNVEMYMSPWGRGIWYITAELLKNMGRVSLFISHGTHPVPINRYHEISIFNMCRGFMLGDYSHIAVGTPIQEAHLRYFKDKYKWINNTEVKSGPLIFADLNGTDRSMQKKKLGLSPDEIILTHATSTKCRGGERYYFLETPDELFAGLSDIVDAVSKMQDTRLIIRIHPGFYLSDEEIRTLLPPSDKYIINRTGPFNDVLAATDILISYSSTTIDEALLNGIPVLLYDKWDRYSHFNTAVYDGDGSVDIYPVCYVNNKDRLQSALLFMINKLQDNTSIYIDRYKYRQDHKENFYSFILDRVQTKGETA